MYVDNPGTSGNGPDGAVDGTVEPVAAGRFVASRADSTTSLRPNRRPSTAAPAAMTASEPAAVRNSRRDDARSAGTEEPAAPRPARSSQSRPNSVPMPAAVESRAAMTPVAVEPSGFSRYDHRPIAPNATKPATGTHHRRTAALPSTAPSAID